MLYSFAGDCRHELNNSMNAIILVIVFLIFFSEKTNFNAIFHANSERFHETTCKKLTQRLLRISILSLRYLQKTLLTLFEIDCVKYYPEISTVNFKLKTISFYNCNIIKSTKL